MADNQFIRFIQKCVLSSRRVRVRMMLTFGPLYLSLIALFVIVSIWLDKNYLATDLIPEPFSGIMGILLVASGFAIMGHCAMRFFCTGGSPVPMNPPPKLVCDGPYRITRNPMLTGVFTLMFGFGFYFNSVILVFVATPLFILINYLELKMVEEPELIMRFGQDYIDYRNLTPMFFPRPIPQRKKKLT